MPPHVKPHFDGTINLGTILAFASTIVVLVGSVYVASYRLQAVEVEMAQLRQVVIAQAIATERLAALSYRVDRLERRQ